MRRILIAGLIVTSPMAGCHCGHDENDDDTSQVGGFDGLFDGVAIGFNFPFDIAIVAADPEDGSGILAGDILVANYGTSEILRVENPSERTGVQAMAFFAGPDAGLLGATAVSIPPGGEVWATFEQGGDGDNGGIVVVSPTGDMLTMLDGSVVAGAFAHPGGICWGGTIDNGERALFFFVNLGNGTAWRVSVANTLGEDPILTRIGTGLASGTPGNPGTPGAGITSSTNLPVDGARGCTYFEGSLYVADAQNARIVRFDGVVDGEDVDGVALEDTPPSLVTYPTDVAINNEGVLIVISYDNAHAFVSLETPTGGFLDNGLHDLNVNSGNYGMAVANGTIWFTRANNQNGTLRAITPAQDVPPTTDGPFPPQ